MRKLREEQKLGVKSIDEIKIMKSRHELSYVLRGLVRIYTEKPEIIELIENDLTRGKSNKKGREEMSGLTALCLLVIRNSKGANYAELEWMLHNDRTIREILGDSDFNPIKVYDEKTIHQNLNKITENTIKEIDKFTIGFAVKQGYEKSKKLRGDSFVCKSKIHFPSESSILWDCGRVIIKESQKIDETIIGRQYKHWLKRIKSINRNIGNLRKSKRKNKDAEIKRLHRELFSYINRLLEKINKKQSIKSEIENMKKKGADIISSKYSIISAAAIIAEKMMELGTRRIFLEEKIPNNEKILSLFEQHVELINRGKYPIAIEFGHKIFIQESRSGFIVDCEIMKKGEKDSEMIKPSIEKIKNIHSLTFKKGAYDKGFHTPENQEKLPEIFEEIVIPKKGKRNAEELKRETAPSFIRLRLWRSGIESLISCLIRGNGMGQCPDKGLKNYKKYVASCVLSRNLHKLGEYLLVDEDKKIKKTA